MYIQTYSTEYIHTYYQLHIMYVHMYVPPSPHRHPPVAGLQIDRTAKNLITSFPIPSHKTRSFCSYVRAGRISSKMSERPIRATRLCKQAFCLCSQEI